MIDAGTHPSLHSPLGNEHCTFSSLRAFFKSFELEI